MSESTATKTRMVGRTGHAFNDEEGYSILGIEVDASCADVRHCCAGNGEVSLCKHDDAPEFLRGNPFVIHGYRKMLPFTLCLKSLFTWNNDTVNIWTHLIGFLIFFFLLIHDNAVALTKISTKNYFVDQLVMSVGLLCFQFCLLCSTGYHVFRCHSPKTNLRWLNIDMTGILVGLLGCYLPSIHFGFYCLSLWRDVYMMIIGLLFFGVFYSQTKQHFYSQRWFRVRLLLYVGLTAYGVIPAAHWIYMNGGWRTEIVQLFAPNIVIIYLLAAAAFTFYITQFPERFFPGRFDYVGSSHQCWHVIVVVLFLWCYYSGDQLIAYRSSHPCQG